VLFGLDLARRSIAEHNEALLVEGQADVIALHQAGFTHAVATSGTSLTADHLALLKKFAPLITVIFDADEAGRKAMSRAIELALAGGMDARCVVLPTGEDPDSLIRAKGADAMQQALDAAMPWMEYQTERFRALGYLTDPTKQSVAVRTMLGWITSIPDKIQHPFLIRELARRFDLPEDLLLRESGTVRSTTPRLPKPPTTPAEPVRVARPTLLPAERTLLKVALTVENGLTDMLHVFEVSAETFVTPLATEVFDRVLQAAEEHHDFTDHLISTQDFTEDARGVLLEIVQSAEGVSTRWLAHNVDIPVLETHRLIRDAITWLKSHRIKLELDDLQARLKAVQDHEEVLRIANKIGVLKQKQLELKQGLDYPTQEPSWHDADSASAS
jgi:DNA primase